MRNTKVGCGAKAWIFPLPVALVGIDIDGKPFYSIVKNCGVLCVSPPVIYISLSRSHPIYQQIIERGFFSVNTPSTALLNELNSKSASETIKSKETIGFETVYDDVYSMPLIKACPISLVCRITESFTLHDTEIIIGAVEKTYAGKQYLTEGTRNPNAKEIDPLVYVPDHLNYWAVDRFIADAFSIGNRYKKGPKGTLKHFFKSRGKSFILKSYSNLLSFKKKYSADKEKPDQKVEMPARSLLYPLPTILLGSNVSNKANYSVVANCGIMTDSPPVVYVSSVKSHFTNIGIMQNKTFSINIPPASLIKETDYCGIVSGRKINKSNVFTTNYNKNGSAPLIEECPLNMECRVIKTLKLNHMDVFIGQIVETFVEEKFLAGDKPDITKINPILYALNRKYWTIKELKTKKSFPNQQTFS